MANISNFREKVLIGRLKLKDKDAFAELYDFYIDRIYRFIYFKVSNKEEAEDLTAQVFLKIWQFSLEGKIKIQESFQALLYKAARNTVIDYYRSNINKRKSDINLESAEKLISPENGMEKQLHKQMEMEKLISCIKKLKTEYQEVIILHYINELSIAEIADILDKKRGTVRVGLHRAINALKNQQEKQDEI